MANLYAQINFNSANISGITPFNSPSFNQPGPNNSIVSSYFVASRQQYYNFNPYTSTNNGISIGCWFRADSSNGTWSRIFDFGNGPGNENIIIFINNRNIGLSVYRDGRPDQPYNIINNVCDNVWRHIVWTMNPNGQWIIYLNGRNIYSKNGSTYPKAIKRNNNYIARSNWNDPFYTGNIADFRIYNSVLSESDVINIYNPSSTLTKYDTSVKWNWTYAPTVNKWYVIPPNNRIGNWSSLGITDNTRMTMSFYINITRTAPDWRNIIHVTNDGNNCCSPGQRIPAIWIWPNSTALHIRFSSEDSGNNGIDTGPLTINKNTYVSIVFKGGITVYFDGQKVGYQPYWMNMIKANPSAIVFVGDPWYGTIGGFSIQNLSIANGDIYNIPDTTSHYDTNTGQWILPNSKGKWYSPTINGYITTWNLLGIKSASDMTMSFSINISARNPNWRNIIHITNNDMNCCNKGDRVPGIWINPNGTSILVVSSTINNGNEHFYSTDLPLNQEILVQIIWLKRKVYIYFNSGLNKENTFSSDFIQPNSNATVYIVDPWHSQGGFKIKDFTLSNGNKVFTPPSSFGNFKLKGCWNDKGNRAIVNYNGNVNAIQDCANIASQKSATIFGVQNGGECWTSTNNPSAYKHGKTDDERCVMNGKTMGGPWTNLVYEAPYQYDANYKMSNTELSCYKDRYPDLSALNNEQLQQHWTNTGANQNRENQCPTIQKSSGMYNFKGCYVDTGNRAIPNLRGNVKTVDECRQLAYNNKDVVFGVQAGSECWTGNNESEAYKYGILYDRNKCGPLGKGWSNQVYVSSQGFPPPPPPVPVLKSPEFSNSPNVESFQNELINYNDNNYKTNIFLVMLLLIIIISIIFIFYKK